MKNYTDLADLPEDDRIRLIGEFIERQAPGVVAGVIVEADGSKADRYIKKLTTRYKVRVIETLPAPVPGSTLIRLAQRGDA